ncbi:TraR/DksA C4-type zinc finger protein [Patescibacteria group bacterium]|nr:TraR/DksA C4-type zinc finger protein [Patescibacteria group bacterium]
MKKEILEKLKAKLEKEKENLEKELKSFAKKNPKLKGDWNTKYPEFNRGVGSQGLEDAADEVEEYLNLLPIEANLELRLQLVNSAFEKMKKGKYGRCEKCKKQMSLERLKAYPEAQFCIKCKK